MFKLQHCLKGAMLMLVLTVLAFAQTTPAKLSVVIGEQKIKFTPSGQVQELRLEVHNNVGELIYDSGALAEVEINWNMQTGNGQPLTPGLYAYTLSIKAPDAAEPQKHQGHLIIEKDGNRLWLTTKSDGATGAEVAGDELLVARDAERTTTGAGYAAAGRTLAERDAQGHPLAGETVPALATTLSAQGLDNFYGVNMAACVPTGQTSAQSVLFNSAGDASFRDGGSGEIILTCAIPYTLRQITKMTVRYKDDGVRGAGSQVVTALRQKRYVFNGITEGVDSAPSTIAEADSNAFVPPVVSPQGYRDHQKNVLPTNGTLTLDHRQFFYYIQVNMRRPAGTTGPVTVAYVTLF